MRWFDVLMGEELGFDWKLGDLWNLFGLNVSISS